MTDYIQHCKQKLAHAEDEDAQDYWLHQLRQARRISQYLPEIDTDA